MKFHEVRSDDNVNAILVLNDSKCVNFYYYSEAIDMCYEDKTVSYRLPGLCRCLTEDNEDTRQLLFDCFLGALFSVAINNQEFKNIVVKDIISLNNELELIKCFRAIYEDYNKHDLGATNLSVAKFLAAHTTSTKFPDVVPTCLYVNTTYINNDISASNITVTLDSDIIYSGCTVTNISAEDSVAQLFFKDNVMVIKPKDIPVYLKYEIPMHYLHQYDLSIFENITEMLLMLLYVKFDVSSNIESVVKVLNPIFKCYSEQLNLHLFEDY